MEKEYAAWIQPETYDSLEPSFPCPASSKLLVEIWNEAGWLQHLRASAALMGRFDDVAGLGPGDEDWHVTYDQ